MPSACAKLGGRVLEGVDSSVAGLVVAAGDSFRTGKWLDKARCRWTCNLLLSGVLPLARVILSSLSVAFALILASRFCLRMRACRWAGVSSASDMLVVGFEVAGEEG